MADVAHNTQLQLGDGATPELFTTIGGATSITGPSWTAGVIDITDLDNTAKAFLAAPVDSGEVTIDVNFEEDATIHAAMVTKVQGATQDNYYLCWGDLTANNFAFLAGDVTVAADTITENAHGLHTGQPVLVGTDDTMPPPLVVNTVYYVIWVDANTIQLATTNANAVAGTQIDITGQGVGNHALYYGGKVTFSASVTNVEPSGAVEDKLSAALTFKITGAVT